MQFAISNLQFTGQDGAMESQALHIQLLGAFRLCSGAAALHGPYAPRLQALLAFLLLHRDAPQLRRQIAAYLWPDSSEQQALTNLRNLLHQLRHTLPSVAAFLVGDRSTLQWCSAGPFHLDVAAFEQALAQADQAARAGCTDAVAPALEAALAAYAGDLLPACYDEWILPERERLRRLFIAALERLIALHETQRSYPAAIEYARRFVTLEPLHEAAYLRLMRLYALNGDRAAALQTYQACADVLRREFAAEPGQPLHDAYARLLAKRPATPPSVGQPQLVGRRREWAQVLDCWHGAAAGQAQLLVLSGDAGIGKTRLAAEVLHWAEQQGFSVAGAQCYPGEGELVYAPVIAWLRAHAIRAMLSTLPPVWLAEIARLLPELRAERPDIAQLGPLREPWQRQHLFEALRRVFLAIRAPLLLFVDDLHWCDGASLAWLRYLMHDDAPTKILLLGTLRPDELPATHPLAELLADLRARGRASLIELTPLDAGETAALAAQVLGRSLSSEESAAIYRESEGNPLFIIETLHTGAVPSAQDRSAADAPALPPIAPMPARVQAVITRRLAQLSPLAHEIAGVAAVIGRAFTVTALAHTCGDLDEAALLCGLDELWQRRIIREQGAETYDFSHDKLREVAYGALSSARRRMLHRRVAQALETMHGPHPNALSAQIAAHYAQAGCIEQAIRAYRHAVDVAQRVRASAEALNACRYALALIETAPPEHLAPETARELAAWMQEHMADALALLERHEAARTAYSRALALAPPEDRLTRARLQRLIGNSWRAQAQFEQAEQAYQAALAALDQRDQGDGDAWREWLEIVFDQLESALWLGPSLAAIGVQWSTLQAVLERYGTPAQRARSLRILLSETCWRQHSHIDDDLIARAEHALQASETADDPTLLAQARWLVGTIRLVHGDLVAAEAHLQAALVLSERVGNLPLQAYCLGMLGLLARRQDPDRCRHYALRTLALAEAYHFHDCLGVARADLAWLAWRAGDVAQAASYGRQALDDWRQTPIVYPFQWTARWPLIAAALAGGTIAEAIDTARPMLHPLQQQLPAALEAALATAISAFEAAREDDARAALQRALTLAQEEGFL